MARLLGVESDDERDEDAERVKPKDLEAEVDAETQVEAEAEKLKRSNQLSSGVEKILDYLSNASKRRGSRIKQILNNRKRTLANRRLIEQRVQVLLRGPISRRLCRCIVCFLQSTDRGLYLIERR